MKRKITWFVASLILVLLMVLVSCGPATPTQTQTPTSTPSATTTATPTTTPGKEMVKDFMGRLVEKPQYGGTLRPQLGTDPASLDPADGASLSVYTFNLVFEKLGIGDWTKAGAGTGEQLYLHSSYFDFAKYGKSNLAESWEMTDPLTLTVHIRKGIRFQNKAPVNGRELTAEDVRYCFQRYQDNPAAPADFRPYLASITAPDKQTVVFKFKQPYCKAIEDVMFGRVYIYAPELVTTYGNVKDWRNFVGTGPFIMKDYVQGSSLSFEKNPNYWATDEIIPGNRLPYVDKVQGIVVTDPSTILASLRTGKTDWSQNISGDNFKTLKPTASQLLFQDLPCWEVHPLMLLRVDEKPLSDLRVRQAMQMAVDYEGIMKDYLGGARIPIVFPIMPQWGDIFTPLDQMPADIQELFSYNVTKAKQLMAAAGYPNGFDIDVQGWPGMNDRVQIFTGYWKALGINCKISTPDLATAIASIWSRTFHGIAALTPGITGPITCLTWETSTHTYDWTHYNNPEYDALITKLLGTTDTAAQKPLIKQAVQILFRDIPFIPFPGETYYNVWQPWMKQYHGEVCLGGVMGYNTWMSRIWIDEKLKESLGH